MVELIAYYRLSKQKEREPRGKEPENGDNEQSQRGCRCDN